jgi:hypothetical protein
MFHNHAIKKECADQVFGDHMDRRWGDEKGFFNMDRKYGDKNVSTAEVVMG